MRIRANLSDLAEALAWVATVVPGKPQSPALAGVKLVASETDELTVQAFDWDTSHTAVLRVEVSEPGEVLLPGRLLREVVASMKGDVVTLEQVDDVVTVQAGRATFRAQALRLDEYPKLPQMPPIIGKVNAAEAHRLVRTVKARIDDGAPQSGIRGLRLEAVDGTLYAVGVEHAGMSIATASYDGDDFECQVPVRHFDPAAKGMSGELHLGYSEGLIGLADDSRMVTIRTLTGEFAKWRVALREESPAIVTVDRAELLAAVKRASILDAEAPVWLLPIEGGIEVTAGSQEQGDIGDVVEGEVTGEPPEEVAFNASVLGTILAAFDDELVEIGLLHQNKAVTLWPPDTNSQHVVMPRRAERSAR